MSRLKTDAIRNVNASVDGITLDTSGNVAIPNELQLADKIVHTGDTNTFIRFPAADTVSIETAGSERLRIDSNGRVLIGGTSSLNQYGSQSYLQVQGTGYDDSTIALRRDQNNANPPGIIFAKSRAGSLGGNTIVQDDDQVGSLVFAAADGTDLTSVAAEIKVQIDGTPGSNDVPGRIVFATTSDGASSATERLRITSGGLVGINNSSPATVLDIKSTKNSDGLTVTRNSNVAVFLGHNGSGDEGLLLLKDGGTTTTQLNGETGQISYFNAGNIGIGDTSPDCRLHVNSGAADDALKIESTDASVNLILRDSVCTSVIQQNNTTLMIGSDSANTTAGSVIAFYVDGTEQARIANGITFNGDTSTSNMLNDYEEGDFTLHFAVEGYSNASMSGRYGFYRKIGDIVHIWGGGTVANTYGSAAYNRAFEFKNLPFTPKDASGASNPGYVTGVFNYSNLDSTGISNMTGTAPYSFRPRLFNGNTHGRIEAYRSDSGQGSVNASLAFPTNAAVGLYLCYSI